MRQIVSMPSLIAVSVVAVLAFVGGGIAHAATSSATIKVCVTSKNVVRSADAKGKCPKKTRAVAVNKVGPAGTSGAQGVPGPAGAQGAPGTPAPTRLVWSDAPAAATFPMYERVSSTRPATPAPSSFQVAKVALSAPDAGFYSVAVYSEVSGGFEGPQEEFGCSALPSYIFDSGAGVYVDGRKVGSLVNNSLTESTWLEPGAHTFEFRFTQYGCVSDDFFGNYSFKNTHMNVYLG